MESVSRNPSTTTETSEGSHPTSTSQNAEYQDEDSNNAGEFYFESDHLALKGNVDYLNLLKTIAILEAQRTRAIQDYDKVLAIQEDAMKDPMRYVEKLQRGEDLGIPERQVIAELPKIDWSAYSVTIPAESLKPPTRKTSNKPTDNSSDSVVLVRGRLFDDSKPETFNQLWTAEEQRRLEELLVEYPPEAVETKRWQKIAAALGNRTTKQVCSRVQKYFIRLHRAGLPIPGRAPKVQSLEMFRKGCHPHRHQRNKYNLFKQTTFFPSQDVPVYMSDFDDETTGSYQNISTAEYDTKMEGVREDGLSDDDSTSAAHKHQNSTEYQQICLFRRVKRDKETEKGRLPVEHLGYMCDLCKQEPIHGTRWHCVDCPPNVSVDFCTDCVVTQMESSNPHPLTHHLVDLRKSEEQMRGVWDQDYMPWSFSVTGKPNSYNYLDPNFMPE